MFVLITAFKCNSLRLNNYILKLEFDIMRFVVVVMIWANQFQEESVCKKAGVIIGRNCRVVI